MGNGMICNLFQGSILLYMLSAIGALVIIKRQALCNLFCNAACIIASLLGIAASALYLTSGVGPITIGVMKSAILFLSADIKVDSLSMFFLLSLSILVLCVSIYSIKYVSHYIGKKNVGIFHFLYATFILSMLFVFTSANAVFFYVSWEVMSVTSYFLVIFDSENKETQKAGTLYIIMTHIAAAFLLIGFAMIYRYTNSFDLFGSAAAIPDGAKNIMFLLFLVGFGTKAGVIPFHIWLPYAHPAAPSNISALMSGLMIKTGIYGLLRFVFCYLGIEQTWWGVLLLCLGTVTLVLGIAYAFIEKNVKRLLALSSVENIGVILIGLGVCFLATAQGKPMIAGLALTAALLHTFNHALFKGGLFLGAGAIQYATHTKQLEELGGLIKKMPVTAVLMLCFSLAVSSILPFNGFIGEWLTYQALFASIMAGQGGFNILSILVVGALGLAAALAAACFVKLFGISFLGLPRSDHAAKAKEVPLPMNIGMGILGSLCLFLGLFPSVLLNLIDKVILGTAGYSMTGQLQGNILIAYYPLDMAQGGISPLFVLLAVILLILLSLLVIRILGGTYVERKYGTWDCGFNALNERMQYSATGFSKPMKIVFRALYRASRETKVTGDLKYFPASVTYVTASEPVFEKYLYRPIYGRIKMFSKRTKFRIQTGRIHSYLFYIFVVVLVLMLYNSIV